MIHHLKTGSKTFAAIAAAMTLGFAAQANQNAEGETAMPDRPAAEIARDAGRKPKQVLAYLDVRPGMKIWDHASSTGYYAAIFSDAVGPEGMVYAQNRPAGWERLKDGLAPRYEAMGNVTPFIGQISEFEGEDGTFDMVFTGLIYHHMHYNENTGNDTPDASKAFFAKALELLKPGGTYVIIEHQAPDGTPRAQSAAWHRATLANAINDLTSAGFEFVGTSDILANPDDPQNAHFRELSSGRDSSQRFIVKFRKPE